MSDAIRMLQPYTSLDDDGLAAVYAVRDRAVPWLRVNMISTADGASTRDGVSGPIGTAPDRRVFEVLRWLSDAIVVGAGTVRAEGYAGSLISAEGVAWRRDAGLSAHPRIAIVSGSLDLDPESRVFAEALERPLILTRSGADPGRRAALSTVADVLDCGGASVDLAVVKQTLAELGLPQQHCEGGPQLLGSLAAESAIDELCLTISPLLEGGREGRIADSPAAASLSLRLAHALAADDGTLLLRYTRP